MKKDTYSIHWIYKLCHYLHFYFINKNAYLSKLADELLEQLIRGLSTSKERKKMIAWGISAVTKLVKMCIRDEL